MYGAFRPRREAAVSLLGIARFAADSGDMWSLIFRLAMMGGAVLVMWNVVTTFARALRHPARTVALPPESRDEATARELVQLALERITTTEVAMAALKDPELWSATEGFAESAKRLTAAVLADPGRYRRARRHLGQILFGAAHVAKRFQSLYAATPDAEAKARMITLFTDLEATYARAAEQYAKAGMDDLEVETDVLRQLLDRARR